MGSLPLRSHPTTFLNNTEAGWMPIPISPQRNGCSVFLVFLFFFNRPEQGKGKVVGRLLDTFLGWHFEVYIRDVVNMEEKNVNFLHMHLHFLSVQYVFFP